MNKQEERLIKEYREQYPEDTISKKELLKKVKKILQEYNQKR
jgi:FMN-dependent NADH-azoreductase